MSSYFSQNFDMEEDASIRKYDFELNHHFLDIAESFDL